MRNVNVVNMSLHSEWRVHLGQTETNGGTNKAVNKNSIPFASFKQFWVEFKNLLKDDYLVTVIWPNSARLLAEPNLEFKKTIDFVRI